MWPVRKAWILLAMACLIAAAFLLPERLSAWNDRLTIDRLTIETANVVREGFAESVQMTVAEKLILLRSGTLTAMDLNGEIAGGVYDSDSGGSDFTILYSPDSSELAAGLTDSPKAAAGEENAAYTQETREQWEGRLVKLRQEVGALQNMGGLPEIWASDSEVSYTGYGEWLYMDTASRMSFPVYHMLVACGVYSLDVLVDEQSGRILSFNLGWSPPGGLNWGLRDAARFGGAWRNYWEMDAVAGDWYSPHNQIILERTWETVRTDGEYSAHSQIGFTYDGQTVSVPLECWGSDRGCTITWNS